MAEAELVASWLHGEWSKLALSIRRTITALLSLA
jgi:hypothetical protein